MKLEVDYCKHTTICYNLTPQERSVNLLCADRNCPEWKALYTEARSWCFHHIIQVHTRNVDPNQVIIHEVYCQLYQDREVGASLFPRLWFTHYRGYQPSIMSLIENKSVRREIEVVIWSRSVVSETTSTVKWKYQPGFFMWRRTYRCSFFSGSSLCCSSRKGTLSIWLVKLQYIVFALWTPYNAQKAELNLAQGGQWGLLKWHNMTALV